jgi:hypothetical protein
MNVKEVVREYRNNYNLNVLPTAPKEKRPIAKNWKELQQRFLTDEEIDSIPEDELNENIRVGVVCGQISQNLEVIDIDNKTGKAFEIYEAYKALPSISEILSKCPVEKTQSGGYHIYYRCEIVEGNQKLASVKLNGILECIIETRGEGGFCVCAPCWRDLYVQNQF